MPDRVTFVMEGLEAEFYNMLRSLGTELILIPRMEKTYPAVDGHPDIHVSVLTDTVVVDPLMLPLIQFELERYGVPWKSGEQTPGIAYPESACYNALYAGTFGFHHKRLTDPVLRKCGDDAGVIWCHIQQGYGRCSTAVLDNRSAITADKGVKKALENSGVEVFEIAPGSIKLKGAEYGFIGGTMGVLGEHVVFYGSLEKHPDGERIKEFIESRGLKAVCYDVVELQDIGSLLVWERHD